MQIEINANLSAPSFPLWSTLQNRTVLVGRFDQRQGAGRPSGVSKESTEEDQALPEAYYMHNVIPTAQGYKSVTYHAQIAADTGSETFVDVVPIRSELEVITLLASTATGKYFLYDNVSATWKDVTPVGATLVDITTAYVAGKTYICLSLFEIYTVDFTGLTLVPTTLAGIVTNSVVGISGSNNYLLLHDGQTVFWSSATDPEDFVPSLITGAGSGIPASVKGEIKLMTELSTGFAIYSTANIVLAAFSGNTRFPWIFTEARNSAGINYIKEVSASGDEGTNYAWTSAGLLKISATGAKAVFPEFSDFLAGRVFEDYNAVTEDLDTTFLTENLNIRLLYSSSRYIVLSYGITDLTHALIYDTALKRLGKLKTDHVKAFELKSNLDFSAPTYGDLQTAGLTYGDLAGMLYNNIQVIRPTSAEPRRLLAFLKADGSVEVAVFDYGDFSANAVLILGKYQLVRSNLVSMQEVEVESIDEANSNFVMKVITSLDGKNPSLPNTAPYLDYDANNVKRYLLDKVGVNHSLLFTGAFNLIGVTFTLKQEGKN